MFNTGHRCLYRRVILRPRRQLLQRAAEAGNVANRALVQLADESGDETAEAHWARLGARPVSAVGRRGCCWRQRTRQRPTMRRARDFLEQAAERGDLELSITSDQPRPPGRPAPGTAPRHARRAERRPGGDRPAPALRVPLSQQSPCGVHRSCDSRRSAATHCSCAVRSWLRSRTPAASSGLIR